MAALSRTALSPMTCSRAIALLLASGCVESDPIRPVWPDVPEMTGAVERGLANRLPIAPATISLNATGSFRPNSPVIVTAIVSANLDLPSTRLRLALPELEVQKRTGGENWRAVIGEILPNEVDELVALRQGTSKELKTAVTFEKPGFYRVVASGFVDTKHTMTWSPPVRDQVHEELWLLILPDGGGSRAAFDGTEIPKEYARGVGAFRSRGAPSAPSKVGSMPRVAARSSGSLRRFIYLDPTIPSGTTYRAVAGSQVYTWEVDEVDRREYGHRYVSTDANGVAEVGCAPVDYYTVRYSLRFDNGDVRFDVANWEDNIDYQQDCGQSFDVLSSSLAGKVYDQMSTVVTRSRQMMGYSRGSIWVHLRDVPGDGGSYYTKDSPIMGDDRITIDIAGPGAAVYGAYGAFTQAHEYGHALHWRSLGGYPSNWFSGLCGAQHSLFSPPSLEDWDCAYVEGFADYLAARVMLPEGGSYSAAVANNPHAGVAPGGRYEIHTASFFFDLADGPLGDEAHDGAAYGDHYVATVVKTCQLATAIGWQRPTGVDGLIACFERTVNTTFPGRPYLGFVEQATEPPSWCRAIIRRIWRANMLDDPQPITCGSI